MGPRNVVLALVLVVRAIGEECADSKTWQKTDAPEKDCAWVGEHAEQRCSAKGEASYAFMDCAAACGTCAPPAAACEDSGTWHKRGDPAKDCDWVAAFSYARATVVGEDGSRAWEGCPAATRVCSVAGCENSETWFKKGDPAKDCAWVGNAINRCIALGEDGAYAFEGCRAACRACAEASTGACDDDPAFYKKNQPAKGCAWVGNDTPARCAARGDSDFAFSACNAACGTC